VPKLHENLEAGYMTANRWWVKLAARWLARIDGVKGQVQMFSLAVTAFSTFSIMLQGFGLGDYVPFIGVLAVGLGITYAYLYSEGGVWNQVAKDRQDMSGDFAPPDAKINNAIGGAAIFAAIHGREPTEDELETIIDAVDTPWQDMRDGVLDEG
jgi:hypothetical protein